MEGFRVGGMEAFEVLLLDEVHHLGAEVSLLAVAPGEHNFVTVFFNHIFVFGVFKIGGFWWAKA